MARICFMRVFLQYYTRESFTLIPDDNKKRHLFMIDAVKTIKELLKKLMNIFSS